ncbi:MAG: DUF1062 domain-containing protein [Myxococcota bacterium]
MLEIAVWRVEALALPTPLEHCARCAQPRSFVCSERFRVNANGGRLDVWLLYRCPACEGVRKLRVLRRARVAEIARAELDGYQADAPRLVRRWAFANGTSAPLPYRVIRPPLPECGALSARIVQPEPCGVRWDRFLARELGWSRGRVARAFREGALSLHPGASLARAVSDGDELLVVRA